MVPHSDIAALFARGHRLPAGLLLRLRLARPGDELLLAELLAEIGVQAGELDLARLVRFDPRRRLVVCATVLIDSTESAVGFGTITSGRGDPAPDAIVVHPEHDEVVRELLSRALTGWGRAREAGTAA